MKKTKKLRRIGWTALFMDGTVGPTRKELPIDVFRVREKARGSWHFDSPHRIVPVYIDENYGKRGKG